MKQALDLLDQLILTQKEIDKQESLRAIAEHRSIQSLGTSFMMVHLQNLKELLLEKDSSEERSA